MRKNKNRESKGFTIIEILAAIFIILVALVTILGVVSQSLSSITVISHRLTGAYLAQEGIEIVRNIRDGNWLKYAGWREGLGDDSYQADYTSTSLSPYDPNASLKISGSFYKYSSGGTDTKYQREIILTTGTTATSMNVVVTVFWEIKNKHYEIQVKETLYDWK